MIEIISFHPVGGSEEENGGVVAAAKEDLNEKQKHQLRHRELFLSRQVLMIMMITNKQYNWR